MKVAILDDYQDVVRTLPGYAGLREHEVTVYTTPASNRDALIERLKDKEALVLIRERTVIDDALLRQLSQLKLISQTGKISHHLDLAACTRHQVAVAEGIGSPIAPTELCWSLIMAASRHLLAYCEHLQQGQWQQSGSLGLGRVLNGRTIGVWGFGKIGQRIARIAAAFEMNVLVWGSEGSRELAVSQGYRAAASKAEFFAQSDVLTLHLRLNEMTRHCVTAADLALMKPDALFVNTSRAELVESGALVQALQAGRPGFAALDVYETEPALPGDEPLLTMPNVLCSPHLGFVEQDSYALYFEKAFANLMRYSNGQPTHIANPEVLTTARHQ
ncbi:D-2-hydroxyacid dehydrogenase family protein [Photobacterium galatheae]|uniref:3-phosphoglycerate dehydrogenase n=1 Tax=Photobacterium galatheae TaxID=1654360 RepID=A0A066RKZ5_9GAMM|nr:D-2-hydroxyacid dehydrogenase family protein [Photobacterium galatheae]KDM89771.1 3-phosphoglycerate dehydrogenase [Photobacterium galatheae]MCM0151423.1 D-2-hydroxyacid dehydrogenase family protein [Photobacterium galatheae]